MTDFTVSNALVRCYRALGQLRESIVDSTSTTTTIVDTKLSGKLGNNNSYKDGAAFIISTTDALAPQGEFQRISASDNSTYKLTVDTVFTAAPGSGDKYGYADSSYPLETMKSLLMDTLWGLGVLDMPPDTTTISIASEKTEYVGAVAWKRSKPYKIEKATTSDTNDYRPVEIGEWEYITAAAGTGPTIVFKKQYDTSYPVVRVYYKELHPEVSTYSAKIREELHPNLVTAAFVVRALEWYASNNDVSDTLFLERINKAERNFAEARVRHKIPSYNKPNVKTPDFQYG